MRKDSYAIVTSTNDNRSFSRNLRSGTKSGSNTKNEQQQRSEIKKGRFGEINAKIMKMQGYNTGTHGGGGLSSMETERGNAATNSYSTTDDF